MSASENHEWPQRFGDGASKATWEAPRIVKPGVTARSARRLRARQHAHRGTQRALPEWHAADEALPEGSTH